MGDAGGRADAPYRRYWGWAGANLALAIGYVATATFGLRFFAEWHPDVTVLWLATGLALGASILWGPKLLPGVFAGAAAVGVLSGASVGATVLGAFGNLGEVALGWAVVTRAGFSTRLGHPRDLLVLVLGGLGASVVGATATTVALSLDGPVTGRVWSDVWLGHAGGIVILTPILLLGARGTPSWRGLVGRGEFWLIVAAVGASGFVVFSGVVPSVTFRLVATFLPYLILVWAGTRLGPRGTVTVASLAALLAIGGRAGGAGPLGEQGQILLLWVYLITLSVTAVVSAITVEQRDVADRARRTADLEVRNLEDAVRHAQRLEGIGLLAGGIAHDFNNLLLVIRANANLIEAVGTQVEHVAEIEAASRQAADLCQQLLVYAGRGSPSLEPVDLCVLVDEMRTLLRTRLPAGIRVETEFRTSGAVRADESQVRQAVMNLVLNASEALGPDGGTIRLRIDTMECEDRYLTQTFIHSDAPPGRFVFLDVEDDGCGMDADTLRRMFDPFFTTKANGRGLGLMTVAGVARSHRGAIKVTSTPGGGSCFRLLLQPSDGSSESRTPSLHRGVRPRGGTILVADDEPAVLRAAERILRKAGFVVLTARDGAEAVEVYRANADRVDVVLMDVSMPGLTGPDAIARMRERAGAPVPVVLMSGNLPDGTLPAEGGQILTKPFGVDALLDALSAAVAGRAA